MNIEELPVAYCQKRSKSAGESVLTGIQLRFKLLLIEIEGLRYVIAAALFGGIFVCMCLLYGSNGLLARFMSDLNLSIALVADRPMGPFAYGDGLFEYMQVIEVLIDLSFCHMRMFTKQYVFNTLQQEIKCTIQSVL